jgi:ankyrin repeat protein
MLTPNSVPSDQPATPDPSSFMGNLNFYHSGGVHHEGSFPFGVPPFDYSPAFDSNTMVPPLEQYPDLTSILTPKTLGCSESRSSRIDISDECIQEARSILLARLDAHNDARRTDDIVGHVITFPEPIAIEFTSGDLSYSARQMFESPPSEALFHFFRLCVYLSSNNMMPSHMAVKLIRWIAKNNFRWQLKDIFKSKTTTVEIFATNLLIAAVGIEDIQTAEILIDGGADLEGTTSDFFLLEPQLSALQTAIRVQNMALVPMLLKAGADPNHATGGRTPLNEACYTNSKSSDLVQLLLDAGADVNPLHDSARKTPLQCAVINGHISTVQLLLEARADPNCYTKEGTALQIACKGRTEIVELLIRAGADIETRSGYTNRSDSESCDSDSDSDSNSDSDGLKTKCLKPPILIAAEHQNWEAVQILLEEGAAVNSRLAKFPESTLEELKEAEEWISVFTPLQAAVRAENITMSRMLLSAGAHIDARPKDKFGHTALQIAVMVRNERLIHILLHKGANINAVAGLYAGRTALQAAASCEDTNLLTLLLNQGADMNAAAGEELGRTALQAAVCAGNIEGVRILLEAGADVNAHPSRRGGKTALEAAVGNEDKGIKAEMFGLLLAKGALINQPSTKGHCPIHTAVANKDFETTSMLLMKGADPNIGYSANTGRTPLQAAASKGDEKLIQVLLDYRADVNAPAYQYGGRTALQAAAEQGFGHAVSILLRAGAHIEAKSALFGLSAIEAAVKSSNHQLVRLLLDQNPNIISSYPDTNSPVLTLAMNFGNCDISLIEMLLKAGSDVNSVFSGESYLQMAAGRGRFDLVQMLLLAGAKVDLHWRKTTAGAITALQAAVATKNIDIVQMLLDYGADVNVPANEAGGKTAGRGFHQRL